MCVHSNIYGKFRTYGIEQIDDFRDIVQIGDEDHLLHGIRGDGGIGAGTRQLHRSRPVRMVAALCVQEKSISPEFV